ATRAEAAYSAARFLGLDATAVAAVGESSLSFEVPELTPWQQRVLQKAVRFIGYPYVLGGTSESRELPAGGGVPAHGGFDCSGLVWRVYKLQKYPGRAPLPATIRGRTTYQMSGEVPRSERIAFPAL